ncbi:MAG TPA: MFS transporter [Kofleriaceae bacterium]|nr:MFS transporter [Kofleriaceae bacterium]
MTKLPEQPLSREVMEMNQPAPTRAYRYYVLAILVLVYTLNFLDRQILGILAAPIKKELSLTDSELGLMAGLAFAVLYSTLALPIAWLADRSSRRRIMAWALGLWSLFTAVCGFAQGFGHLFLARIGVGVGEAGGVAPAYSMVSDYFPKHQRARALSIYSLGIPIGSGCGILFGGLIAANIDWRWAFFIVGTAGVVLAPVFRATIKDPPRGGFGTSEAAAKAKAPSFSEVRRTITSKRSFWLMALGAASSSVCGYGLAFWLPSFFQRSMGLSLVETAWYYGAITFFGGCLGIMGGGILADRMGARSKAAYPRIPAVAFLIAMPCFLIAINTSSLFAAFPLFLVPTALNLMWLGPILTAVQHLVPGNMRTTASAMFLMVNNLLGIAVGNYYFGAVSDALRPHYGDQSLRYAIYTGLGFYVIAAILFVLASKSLAKDWVDDSGPKAG